MTNQLHEPDIRTFLVELFLESDVYTLRDENLDTDFIDGKVDVDLNRLDMDSLAAMEVCIGIEVNYGVSIVPEQLGKIRKLSKLAKLIERSQP